MPGARVIVGGLTNPRAFLPAMLRARPDLAGHIDGVAIHPYGANPLVVLRTVRDARAVLDSLGLSAVPLYVTEFGWTTEPAGALDWAPAQAAPGVHLRARSPRSATPTAVSPPRSSTRG